MKHIAFVTCEDLSPYFPSQEEPSLTHDDKLAADFLRSKGYKVSSLVWGENQESIKRKEIDLIVVRSPWDYMDTEEKRTSFISWLAQLEKQTTPVLNPVSLMLWSLDKHYLKDLADCGVQIVPSHFVKHNEPCKLSDFWNLTGPFVVKPTISAAAKDTFRILNEKDLKSFSNSFDQLRKDRDFILQPYLKEIEEDGEWSLVFLDETYNHSVLKKPQKGHWLVQDELGGSVHCKEAPEPVIQAGKKAFSCLKKASKQKESSQIAYARVDFIKSDESLYLSEVELVEPELFFLDRATNPTTPNTKALQKFLCALQKALP